MPVRGTRRQGRPVLRAALPARAAVVDGGARGEGGGPGEWPGRRFSATRAGGLAGPVNRRCSNRGAFAQHGSQGPARPLRSRKAGPRRMQSTNPPVLLSAPRRGC